MDRLGYGFWTDEEIDRFDSVELGKVWYSKDKPIQKCICAYEMWTAKGNTKVGGLVATDDPNGTEEALARDWKETNLTPILGQIGELEWNVETKLQALYTVLDKYKHTTVLSTQTSDRLYKWQDWMRNLL